MKACNESSQIEELRRYAILGTPPERVFDGVTALAAQMLKAPIVVLSFVDGKGAWPKSCHGIAPSQLGNIPVPGAPLLLQGEACVFADTSLDTELLAHPWVAGEPGIRYFAALPLTTPSGHVVGSLAVMGRQPLAVGEDELDMLRGLAKLVILELESRCELRSSLEQSETRSKNVELTLQENHRHLRTIIETQPECMKILSASGALLDINEAGLRLLGARDRREAFASSFIELLHFEDREAYRRLHRQALIGESGTLEFRIKGLTGLERWAEAHSVPWRHRDGNIYAVLSIVRDITARKRHEQWRTLETGILKGITTGAPLRDVLESVTLAIDSALPGVMSSILLLNDSTGCLSHGVAPHLPDAFCRAVDGVRIGPAMGSCGTAAYRGEPVHVTDIQADPLWENLRELANAHGLRACWSTPVLSPQGKVTATFALYFREPKAPTNEDRELMTHSAYLVGIAIERTRKVEELAQSQALLGMASRVTRVGAWKVSLPDFCLTWSEEVRILHEVAAGYVPNLKAALEFYAPEYRNRIRTVWKACVLDGIPFDLETELITAKGRRVWVRTLGEAVRKSDGTISHLQGAVQDISSRKNGEEALRQQQWLLQVAGKVAQIGGWAVEAADRRVTLSDTVREMLDLPEGEAISFDEGIAFYLPESQQQLMDAFERCLEQGLPFDLELPIFDTHGEARWLRLRGEAERDADGTILRARGAAQDITDRIRAAQELRTGEDRFRLLASATSDTIWDWDLARYTLWWSDGVRTRFGHDPAELGNGVESWAALLHPEDLDRVWAGINTAITSSESSWSDEYRFRRADGSYALVADHGYFIRDTAGKIVRMVGSMIDITEQRRMEEQMRQSQRLEAVGQLTGGVAHDFNNILTVILGCSELLAGHVPHDPVLLKLAKTTQKAAEQGADLTHRLLAFARKQALHPKVTDINKLIAGTDGLLRRALGEQIELELVRSGGLWATHIDSAQLESAILNLCLNARDAMRDGGKLTIETANTYLDAAYARNNPEITPGQYVMIAVSDTGTGMAPEVAARAFEPFFTTKEVGKGSGLGLSMVYGFVKQSKGHVKIYSEPGYGTTIKIYLPRETANLVESMPVPGVHTPEGTELILVVEDEQLVREYVVEQLQSLGYRIVSARTGPEALDVLDQNPDIGLLFTDIVMPGGMNGRVLADEARRRRPGLAVLFTSGYTNNAIIHHGRLDPGVHLLHKPYRRQDLATKIRQVLDLKPSLA